MATISSSFISLNSHLHFIETRRFGCHHSQRFHRSTSEHAELDNANYAPIAISPLSEIESLLLTGGKLSVAFAAILLALLRTFIPPGLRPGDYD